MSNYKARTNNKYQDKIDELLLLLPDFVFDYVQAYTRTRSPKTLEAYLGKYKIFFLYLIDKHPYFCDMELQGLSADDLSHVSPKDATAFSNFVQKHQMDNTAAENKNNTVEAYISALNSLFKFLIETKAVEYNPFENVKRKHERTENPAYLKGTENSTFYVGVLKGEGLNKKQLAYREAHHTAYRDYLICRVLGTTGIRVSELVGLDADDIDLVHKQFKVVRKGHSEPQTIYFSDKLADELKHYLENERPYYKTERNDIPIEEKKALFLVAQGNFFGQRISVRSVEEIVKKYAKAQGLTDADRFHPHSLRHSMGMMTLAKSQNLRLVQQILGHVNIETSTIYAKMTEEDLSSMRNIGESE